MPLILSTDKRSWRSSSRARLHCLGPSARSWSLTPPPCLRCCPRGRPLASVSRRSALGWCAVCGDGSGMLCRVTVLPQRTERLERCGRSWGEHVNDQRPRRPLSRQRRGRLRRLRPRAPPTLRPPPSPRLMCCCPLPWPSSLARHHPRRVRLHPLHLRIRLSAPARRWGAPSSPPCSPLGRRRRMMPAIRPSNMGLGYQLNPWAGASSPFCHSPLFRRRHLLRAVAFMGPGVFMEGGRLLVKFLFVACGYRKHVSSHHLAPIPFLAPPIRVPSSYTAITAERSSINRTLRLQEADGGDDRTGTAARSVRLCAS